MSGSAGYSIGRAPSPSRSSRSSTAPASSWCTSEDCCASARPGATATWASRGARLSSDAGTFAATIIACGVYLVGMAGQLLGGRVADRRELRWAYLTFFASALPFLLLMRVVEGLPLILMAGGFVLFSLGMQPIENSLVAVLSPPQWRSVSYGIKFTLVFGAGSLAVYLVGFVDGRFGLDAVIYLLAALLAGVIAMILVLLFASRQLSLRHESE